MKKGGGHTPILSRLFCQLRRIRIIRTREKRGTDRTRRGEKRWFGDCERDCSDTLARLFPAIMPKGKLRAERPIAKGA